MITSWWLLCGKILEDCWRMSLTMALMGMPELDSSRWLRLRATPFIHGSYHRLILSPRPTLYWSYCIASGLSFRICFQIQEQSVGMDFFQIACPLRMVALAQAAHKECELNWIIWIKWSMIWDLFQSKMFLIPSPPSDVGRDNEFHATLAPYLLRDVPFQRNLQKMDWIDRITI